MTANRNLKRRVRRRAAKTGESYTAALRHFRATPEGDEVSAGTIRLAVAQTTTLGDPRATDAFRQNAEDVRAAMRSAHELGAHVVQFAEGTMLSPHKKSVSGVGREGLAEADWSVADWELIERELRSIVELAGALRLWTVLGSQHRLTPPNRPHNSLYVISDRGVLVDRYDERMLSNTKVSYMYSPGTVPVTFEVDGFRFGCLLGMEVHFPELFGAYEQLDVDCVLYSSTGRGTGNFAREVQAHAAMNNCWIGFAVLDESDERVGVVAPSGEWLVRGTLPTGPDLVLADLDDGAESLDEALHLARPWRRRARGGVYEQHLVHGDPRSENRAAL